MVHGETFKITVDVVEFCTIQKKRGSFVETNDVSGIRYSILAYTDWGVLPLYWKLLNMVPAVEILAHRILWSFVFMGSILLFSGDWRNLAAAFSNRRAMVVTFLCGFLISLNWFTYIWAVNSNRVIEASMGYYINPLLAVALGVTVLKERLGRWQLAAIILAAAGVLIMTVRYGRIPWIALALAGTFALYGLAKKLTAVDSVTGLALETFIVLPLALLFIVSREVQGIGALGTVPFSRTAILVGSGVVTATPLLWFAKGARKIRLSMLGFLQYIAPTISLLLGIFIFGESFSATHLVSFGFIWAGLLVFTLTNLGVLKLVPEKTKAF
jgi:chloramphenicol-sensitive protein RarD